MFIKCFFSCRFLVPNFFLRRLASIESRFSQSCTFWHKTEAAKKSKLPPLILLTPPNSCISPWYLLTLRLSLKYIKCCNLRVTFEWKQWDCIESWAVWIHTVDTQSSSSQYMLEKPVPKWITSSCCHIYKQTLPSYTFHVIMVYSSAGASLLPPCGRKMRLLQSCAHFHWQ